MANFWLKVKVWTKTTLFAVLVIYGLLFIYNNSGEEVTFWWWFGHTENHGKLVFGAAAFFAGVVITILLRTTFITFRQVNDLKSRSRNQRLEREVMDMKDKASRLQTRPSAAPTPIAGAFEAPDPIEKG